jgi:hypothetical protein
MQHPGTKLVVTTWLGLVGSGLGLLLHHGVAQGATGTSPTSISERLASTLQWTKERPLLVLCAHPQCPCLPSTLGELKRVLVKAPPVDLRVVLLIPSEKPPEWNPEEVTALRTALPNATFVEDPDGTLAGQLGALTSGHVLLFDTGGQLQFSGGITAGRAHVGDNDAGRTLTRVLGGNCGRLATTPVFGCPLNADEGPDHGTTCCQSK